MSARCECGGEIVGSGGIQDYGGSHHAYVWGGNCTTCGKGYGENPDEKPRSDLDPAASEESAEVGRCGICQETRELVAEIELKGTTAEGCLAAVTKEICERCVIQLTNEIAASNKFVSWIGYEDGTEEHITRGAR